LASLQAKAQAIHHGPEFAKRHTLKPSVSWQGLKARASSSTLPLLAKRARPPIIWSK
jgi:hypothetical protein